MEGIITESAKQLVTQGILGLMVVVEAIIIVVLYKENRQCSRERIEEARVLTKTIEDSSRVIGTMTLALESSNRTQEARTRATEDIAERVERLILQHDNFTQWVREKLLELRKGGS